MVEKDEYLLELDDGLVIRVRLVAAHDTALLIDLFDHLSPDTRYRRFQEPLEQLSRDRIAQEAAQIVQFGLTQGKLWLALADLPDEPGVMVAGGRYVRTGADSAEIAVTVRDDLQQRGIGSFLLELLIDSARADGLKTLLGLIHHTNEGARRLVQGVSVPVTFDSAGTHLTAKFTL